MKIIFTVLFALTAIVCFAQNINYESRDLAFFRYPLKPLDPSAKTYSSSLQDLSSGETRQRDSSLIRALRIEGYERVRENGDVQLELIISPLAVTSKETKDIPLESESGGKKTVIHQYSYFITYSFPAKLRITCKGKLIADQDLPGNYSTGYFPRDRTSLTNLQQEYDNDFYFLDGLRQKRVEDRVIEIRNYLASNYGKGIFFEIIDVGYVKDKKGLYDDVNKPYALILNAFEYAHKKQTYLDETYKSKLSEAITQIEEVLKESSDDKKARIDPKVTAMLQYNKALALWGLHEMNKAEEQLTKIEKVSVNTLGVKLSLKNKIQDRRARLAVNGLLGGPVYVAAEITPSAPLLIKPTRDYVVGRAGDTLDVRFINPSLDVMTYGDSVWLQDRIIIMKGDKRVELNPPDIHGYCFKGVFRESLIWQKNTNNTTVEYEKKFCQRIVSGPISVYRYYNVINSFSDPREKVVTKKMYYKKDDKLREVMFLNFNKGVSKLIVENKELSERVQSGAYGREDFSKIMEEYNVWSKANKK
jgi:hypothetical protein